jgi:MFS family permease
MIMVILAFLFIILIQAGAVGWLSERFGERWLVIAGLCLLGSGLILTSATPSVPVPWYSKTELQDELASSEYFVGEINLYRVLDFELPGEGGSGWLGIGWFTISLSLVLLGGGLLTPAINSLLMDAAPAYAQGGVLGVSSGLTKAVEISAPLVLGFTLWVFGWTAPFFIEGVILLFLLVVAMRRLEPKHAREG